MKKKLCDTGIKTLHRNFKVTPSGAVLVVNNNGSEEVIWWPSIEVSQEVARGWDTWHYFINADGCLMGYSK
jgi:hypothetical protein